MATGKEALYGSLDPTTLEWTDGIFTKVLREVSLTVKVALRGLSRTHADSRRPFGACCPY